jgi:hypothetical protein
VANCFGSIFVGRYFIWAFFLDTMFALKFIFCSLHCLLTTRLRTYLGQRPSFRNTLKILKEFFSLFAGLEQQARKVFQQKPELKFLIMGHSHVARLRRISENKMYVNSGTWTDGVSLELPELGRQSCITYVLIRYLQSNITSVHLMTWNGFYNITEELRF